MFGTIEPFARRKARPSELSVQCLDQQVTRVIAIEVEGARLPVFGHEVPIRRSPIARRQAASVKWPR